MSIIKWSEELCIGIDRIDEQHRRLINIINELHLAVEYPGPDTPIYPLLHKLHDYARTHFDQEEQLLERHEFPGRADHAREHEAFIGRLGDLMLRYPSNGGQLTVHVRDFLLTWFLNHVKDTDMKYKLFLSHKQSGL